MIVLAMIRIRHGLPFPAFDMVEKKGQARLAARRLHGPKIRQILRIESDDMIEKVEIVGPHLACAKIAYVDTVPARGRDRTPVRRMADMPVPGAGGIHLRFDPDPLRLRTEGRLRQRRAADIAQADEED